MKQLKKSKTVLTAVLIFLALAFSGCGQKEIDLMELVGVFYSGINGNATASASYAPGDLENILLTEDNKNEPNPMDLALLEESIQFTLDKQEGLSNGDEITVSVTWDADIAKECDVKLIGKDKKVIVDGLEDAVEIDIFADVFPEYEGIAPYAYIPRIKNTSAVPFVGSINFHSESVTENGMFAAFPKYVSNGNKIIVKASVDLNEAEKQGFIIKNTEKEFIVEGLDEYINEYSKIDPTLLAEMDAQAKDLIESTLAEGITSYKVFIYPEELLVNVEMGNPEIVDIKLTNSYFLSLKKDFIPEGYYKDKTNILYSIYTVTTKDAKTPEGKTTYIPVFMKNFMLKNTGDMTMKMSDLKTGQSFSNYEDLYRVIITENKDHYTSEEITY